MIIDILRYALFGLIVLTITALPIIIAFWINAWWSQMFVGVYLASPFIALLLSLLGWSVSSLMFKKDEERYDCGV